jgi:type IV fimbrial biogenesis protein FimT
MIVLVIVAVLLMIAAPSYQTVILRTKLKSYANAVVAGVYLARSEAIKRNGRIRLCVSEDGETCAASSEWDKGWIVLDPNDTVIRYRQPLDSGIKLFSLSTTVSTLTFLPNGLLDDDVVFKICQQTPKVGFEERQVSVSITGQPNITSTYDGCP